MQEGGDPAADLCSGGEEAAGDWDAPAVANFYEHLKKALGIVPGLRLAGDDGSIASDLHRLLELSTRPPCCGMEEEEDLSQLAHGNDQVIPLAVMSELMPDRPGELGPGLIVG